MSAENRRAVLCVDLDGTLLATDTLDECLLYLLRNRPLVLFLLPFWLLGGKAHFKERVAAALLDDKAQLTNDEAVTGAAGIPPASFIIRRFPSLPYRQKVLDYIS